MKLTFDQEGVPLSVWPGDRLNPCGGTALADAAFHGVADLWRVIYLPPWLHTSDKADYTNQLPVLGSVRL